MIFWRSLNSMHVSEAKPKGESLREPKGEPKKAEFEGTENEAENGRRSWKLKGEA